MNIKIIVATHKPYWMPHDDIYLPLHVGKAGKTGFGLIGDDTGDNISLKNPNYCELTGLYWAWKNLDVEYIGLAHYRRHFSVKRKKDKKESVLTHKQLEPLLRENDVILPHKRKYYIETIYSHYSHTHDGKHLDETREILKSKYPTYLESFDRLMQSRQAHIWNMFIMKKELVDQYCEWLFDILSELEKHLDTTNMSDFDARLFGRISEQLLDVWIMTSHISYKEIGYIYMEPAKWGRKINGFLKAKFAGVKYSKSW